MSHDGERAAFQKDTTPKAMARYLERLQATPPRERLARAFELSNRARAATMADVERSMPGATARAIAIAFVRRVYGEQLAARFAQHLTSR